MCDLRSTGGEKSLESPEDFITGSKAPLLGRKNAVQGKSTWHQQDVWLVPCDTREPCALAVGHGYTLHSSWAYFLISEGHLV